MFQTLRSNSVCVLDQATRLPYVVNLSLKNLAYITENTGHTQTKYFTLTLYQEQCINNRINNEKVGSTINWSALGTSIPGFGTGAIIGGLVIAPYLH